MKDVTAEVMITTAGKIPNEMYYFDATPQASMAHTETNVNYSESESHSSVLVALLTALILILFMCCITASLVARSKRRRKFFGKAESECEPGCAGMSQPLLNKISDSTNKTSVCSLRD